MQQRTVEMYCSTLLNAALLYIYHLEHKSYCAAARLLKVRSQSDKGSRLAISICADGSA
jgi:hypothetical protein